jgi:hypothetical protein
LSTSVRIADILRQEKVCAELLRQACLLTAFRDALAARAVTDSMNKARRLILNEFAADTSSVNGEFEAIGSSSKWGKRSGTHRTTVSELITVLQAAGQLDILEYADGQRPWRLRWLLATTERQAIEAAAMCMRREKIAKIEI